MNRKRRGEFLRLRPDRSRHRGTRKMIDKRRMYRLPWTRENNPNGWIEPTTHCQLKCPFCYRGADQDGFVPAHRALDDVKEEIDELVRRRNVAIITIAGGEPLMYPHLDETIDYVRSKDLDAMILTNGNLLSEARLTELKKREVTRVVIHIDKYQGRPGVKTERDANRLRQEFCDLFRKVGGVELGFIQPLGVHDADDLQVLLPFFKKNVDVVDLVAFNRMQPIQSEEYPKDELLSASDLFERVREVYGLEYGAYLDKTHSDGVSWLLGFAAFKGQHFLGSVDGKALQFLQEDHYRKTGKWLHSGRRLPLPRRLKYFLPFNRSLRRILLRYLSANGNGNGGFRVQRVLLIDTPEQIAGGEWDRCRGCPDAMLHGDVLVPSCLLELVKEGHRIEAG